LNADRFALRLSSKPRKILYAATFVTFLAVPAHHFVKGIKKKGDMSDESSKGVNIPWSLVFTLLAAVGGAVWYLHPLTSDRPAGVSDVGGDSLGFQDVPARLWQDPFGVVRNNFYPSGAPTTQKINLPLTQPSHAIDDLHEQIKAKLSSSKTSNLLVLGVMVSNEPYAEMAEQRLRARVAVLEGLAHCGLEPIDGEHIGYVEIPWLRTVDYQNEDKSISSDRLTKSDQTLLMPYEWCTPSAVPMAGFYPATWWKYTDILVVWLDEQSMSDYPLTRLAAVKQQLLGAIPLKKEPSPINFSVIGPQVSTTLRQMVLESRDSRVDLHDKPLSGVWMLSPTATAEEQILLADDKSTDTSVASVIEQKSGLKLFRTTTTDDELSDNLVNELCLRLAPEPKNCPCSSSDIGQIALISEWDTFYGRALPVSFAAKLSQKNPSQLIGGYQHWPANIHVRYYLRGIDGKVPGAKDNSDASKASGQKSDDNHQAHSPQERPEGLDQSDYLRRVADDLVDLDEQLRQGKVVDGQSDPPQDKKGLRAIGVLGTDLYDKLLVLRALRDRFPGMLFFTTDLDARYSLPSEWKTTHNLIVVSPFDLRLSENYQRGVPPFRDCYQTATYAATLTALGELRTTDEKDPVWGPPRRFEISRSGPFDLSIDTSPLHPSFKSNELTQWLSKYGLLFATIAALLAVALIWVGVKPEHTRFPVMLVLGCFCLTTVIAVGSLFLLYLDRFSGQPISISRGVSTLPTDILRGFALALSVCFIVKAIYDWRHNDDEMHVWFKLQDLPESPVPESHHVLRQDNVKYTFKLSGWKIFGNYDLPWNQRVALDENTIKKDKHEMHCIQVFVQNLWWEYKRRADTPRRLIRSLGFMILYMGLFFTLLGSSSNLSSPTRGFWSHWVETILRISSVLAALLLLFFVLDGAYLNRKFIRNLSKTITHWPEGAAETYLRHSNCHEWKISPLDLTEFLNIRLIAMRTRAVGAAVYYPFLVFSLMILARSPLFGDWSWPLPLLLIMGGNIVLSIVAAYCLRRAAEQAREFALKRLHDKHAAVSSDQARAKFIEKVIERVENETEGAFSILSQHPTLAAILLPSGGLGIWALLQYFANSAG
jgi:hypothetical protein